MSKRLTMERILMTVERIAERVDGLATTVDLYVMRDEIASATNHKLNSSAQ